MKNSDLLIGVVAALAAMLLPMQATGRFVATDPHAFKYPSISPYVYVANNPLIYLDPDGKDILNDQRNVISNSQVFWSLVIFNATLGGITGKDPSDISITVTGGDRHIEGDGAYSCTDGKFVTRNKKTLHAVENGARAVDVRPVPEISWNDIYKAARLTGYTQILNEHNHYHFGLPPESASPSCEECQKPYVDFEAIEFGHNKNTRGKGFKVIHGWVWRKAVYKDGSEEIVERYPVTVVVSDDE
ncbi:MAG: hypothetical protein AB1483_09205 [Candidatus Zixiibacteriota bacterium]